jgi:hypothetical protein
VSSSLTACICLTFAFGVYGADGSEPRYLVKVDGRFGYFDARAQLVIPARFDRAGTFSEGLAMVEVGRLRGYIDSRGKVVIPPKFHRAWAFSEGRARATASRLGAAPLARASALTLP